MSRRDVPIDKIGPTHAEEAVDWMQAQLEWLRAVSNEPFDFSRHWWIEPYDDQLYRTLQHVLLPGLSVSSDYSGILDF